MGGEESSQIKSKYPGVTSFHEGCACVCVSLFGGLLCRSNVARLHQLASVCKQCPLEGHIGVEGSCDSKEDNGGRGEKSDTPPQKNKKNIYIYTYKHRLSKNNVSEGDDIFQIDLIIYLSNDQYYRQHNKRGIYIFNIGSCQDAFHLYK